MFKKIMLLIGIVIFGIQFFRPAPNKNNKEFATDISKTVSVSDSVRFLLKTACFDCHSNNTNYPWYSNIQPAGWLIANHIRNGKRELNYSEFGTYSSRKQLSKLEGISNCIRDDIMPLSSYKLMHKNATLNAGEKKLLLKWAQQAMDSLSVKN